MNNKLMKGLLISLICAMTLCGCTSKEKEQDKEIDHEEQMVLEDDSENISDEEEIISDELSVEEVAEPSISFDDIFSSYPQNFTFTSGVGSWGTQMTVEEDGTFTGVYSDSNNDGIYICNFTGEFSDLEKIDDYTYRMQLKSLECVETPEEVYYEDDVKYIGAEPYGLEDASEFMLYLPGRDTSYLPKEFLGWVSIAGDVSETLPFYGIYNVNGKTGFFSDEIVEVETEPVEVEKSNESVENSMIEVAEYLDSNPAELVEIFDMQTNTSWQFGSSAASYKYDDFLVEWETANYEDYTMTSAGLALNTPADDGRIYNVSLHGIILGMTGEEVKEKLNANGYIFLCYNDAYTIQSYVKNENGKRYAIDMYFYENQLVAWYWCNWREGLDLPDIDPYTYDEVGNMCE